MKDIVTLFNGEKITGNNLPVMPAALYELNAELANPNCNADRLAVILSHDQVLAVKILKMVNSPTYGFSGRIASLKHAVLLLGANVMRGIIISTTAFGGASTELPGLWNHSLACSQASATIAKFLKLPMPDEFGVGGLLHDIGKLVIAQQLPLAMNEISKLIQTDEMGDCHAETSILGLSHDQINTFLCAHWKLPENLELAMSYHHNPAAAPKNKEMPAVVHLADYYSCKYGINYYESPYKTNIIPDTLNILSIKAKDLEAIELLIGENFIQSGLIMPDQLPVKSE